MLDYITIQTTSQNASLIVTVYSILLTFLLSTVVAVTYEKTFRGLSYSRNYVQSLVLSSIVTCIIMLAIGDSIGRGLGMIGALAIIRFRTNFKDPKDIIFLFSSIAIGISCGVYAYNIAVVGSLLFCVVAVVLYYSPIGSVERDDGMLKFNIPNERVTKESVNMVIAKFCKKSTLVNLKESTQGTRFSYSYHVKLKKGVSRTSFVDELTQIESIKTVSILLQQSTVEL